MARIHLRKHVTVLLALLAVAPAAGAQQFGLTMPFGAMVQNDTLTTDDSIVQEYTTTTWYGGASGFVEERFFTAEVGYLMSLGTPSRRYELTIDDEYISDSSSTTETQIHLDYLVLSGRLKLPLNAGGTVGFSPTAGVSFWRNIGWYNNVSDATRDDLSEQAKENLNEFFADAGLVLDIDGGYNNVDMRVSALFSMNLLSAESGFEQAAEAENVAYRTFDWSVTVSMGFAVPTAVLP